MDALKKLNSLMPHDVQFSKSDTPLTKTNMIPKLTEFARKHPEKYAQNIHKIRELGEELAYINGHNIGLADLSLKNQEHIDNFLEKENKIDRRQAYCKRR